LTDNGPCCYFSGVNQDRAEYTRRESENQVEQQFEQRNYAAYEPPVIVTYTSEEIAEQIGPAQACTSGWNDIFN